MLLAYCVVKGLPYTAINATTYFFLYWFNRILSLRFAKAATRIPYKVRIGNFFRYQLLCIFGISSQFITGNYCRVFSIGFLFFWAVISVLLLKSLQHIFNWTPALSVLKKVTTYLIFHYQNLTRKILWMLLTELLWVPLRLLSQIV